MTRFLMIALCIFCVACSKPQPEELVKKFYQSPDYNLLSDADKKAMNAEEWKKYNYSVLKPKLSPTSKFYELEAFLYKHVSFVFHPSSTLDGKTIVKVSLKYPSMLIDLMFFSDLTSINDELEQALVNFNKGLITESSIQYHEEEITHTVIDGGIFLDLAKVKEKQKISQLIDDIETSLKETDSLTLVNTTHPKINKYEYSDGITQIRTRGIQRVTDDFENYKKSISKIRSLDPENECYNVIRNATDAYLRLIIMKADIYFDSELVISKARVEESTSGDKALFFDWKLKSPSKDKLYGAAAAYSAKFFDGADNQIGYEEFVFSNISNEKGNLAGNVGRSLEDQTMASRTSRVEVKYLFPVSVSMMKCSLDKDLECTDL